jgi:predicted RecA/RadA family phage recombinase
MPTFRQEIDEPINLVAPTGGVTSEVPVIIGPFVVLPQISADAGDHFPGLISGVANLEKATGFVPEVGGTAYFDFGVQKRLESTGTPIGVYVDNDNQVAYASGDTRANVAFGFGRGVGVALEEFQFNLRPANGVATSVDFDWCAPTAGQFDEIQLHTGARPSSSAGTVLETVTNLTGTLNVLTATNVDLEADITNGTKLTPTLSATAANKQFAAGDIIRFRITTNHADAVANAGISHRVRWHPI